MTNQRWIFKDFVSPAGENVIHTWLNKIPKPAKVKINALIRRLEVMDFLQMPHCRALSSGPCSELLELRTVVGNVQYRPICCHGPKRAEVALLVGAIEKGDALVPRAACDTAQERKSLIAHPERTCNHDYR